MSRSLLTLLALFVRLLPQAAWAQYIKEYLEQDSALGEHDDVFLRRCVKLTHVQLRNRPFRDTYQEKTEDVRTKAWLV